MTSLLDNLVGATDHQRDKAIRDMTEAEAEALLYDWEFWARPDQREPPGAWTYWLALAGRGWGKTRVGAEAIRRWTNDYQWCNIIGATSSDVRDIMIEGPAGILACCPDSERPWYRPARNRIDWPNGAFTLAFTADEPDRMRGKQHQRLWADELAAWRYPEAWDQAMFGLRMPPDPRAVITTTPKPVRTVRSLVTNPNCITIRGSTYDNVANLAPAFYEEIIRQYEGTRMGRQELLAELLEEVDGALWQRTQLDELRRQTHPDLRRVLVAIDPAVTNEEASNEAGIIVAGVSGIDEHCYVLEDATIKQSPEKWARRAVEAYNVWEADLVVGEQNNGGDLVRAVIHQVDKGVAYRKVNASRGKRTRAEPVAQLYEQGRVHHVGSFPELEDQMCTWTPDTPESPDRMDALVWAVTTLMLRGGRAEGVTTRAYQPDRIVRGDLTLVGDKYIDKE